LEEMILRVPDLCPRVSKTEGDANNV
jgi:hypothetical protein